MAALMGRRLAFMRTVVVVVGVVVGVLSVPRIAMFIMMVDASAANTVAKLGVPLPPPRGVLIASSSVGSLSHRCRLTYS